MNRRRMILALTSAAFVQPIEAQGPIQMVLDDMDLKSDSSKVNAYKGSYAPCLEDAWNGQYHHDWAHNKGSASYAFKVNVPVSGCYKLEEYHPGKSFTCSRYLPRNARLDVKYCKGKSKTIYINQGVSGGQWNEIDSFPFYKGIEGELTMRSHAEEKCVTGKCFWLVDAFRLTWTGNKCGKRAPQPEPESQMGKMAEREGTLLLQASLDGYGRAQLVLEKHKDVLEVTLAAHLGYKNVQVHGIWKQGRRLYGGPFVERFKVKFVAQDEIVGSSSSSDLRKALQEGFDKRIASGISFQLAVAEWEWEPMPGEQKEGDSVGEEQDRSCAIFYIIVGVVAVVGLLCAGLFMCHQRKKRNAPNSDPTKKQGNDLQITPVQNEEIGNAKMDEEKGRDLEVASVSTGTPGSDDEDPEGSTTISALNSLQQEPEVAITGEALQVL